MAHGRGTKSTVNKRKKRAELDFVKIKTVVHERTLPENEKAIHIIGEINCKSYI